MEELRYEYWMVSSKTCIVIPHNARDIASLREDRRPHIDTYHKTTVGRNNMVTKMLKPNQKEEDKTFYSSDQSEDE